MPTISYNSVESGSVVYINGIVDFSHIAKRIEGEELIATNARRVANGLRPIEKPHTSLSVHDAVIAYANPAQPTLAEQCLAERLYIAKDKKKSNLSYTGMNKSKFLPELYCRDSITSTELEAVVPEGELVPGTSVTLVIRFFKTQQNNGVSLDAVIVNEKPVRYSTGKSLTATLQSRGFTVMPATEGNVDAYRAGLTADAAPAQTNIAPAPIPTQAAPQPQAAPYMQTAPTPAQTAPQSAANPSMPVQPTSWSAQPAAQPTSEAAVSAAQPAAQPAEANAAPSASNLPIPPAGYKYDDNGRIVPITQTNSAPENVAPAGGITLT